MIGTERSSACENHVATGVNECSVSKVPALGRPRCEYTSTCAPRSKPGLILGSTQQKRVGTAFRGESRTSIFDPDAGIALDGTFVKLVSWYDNEWGYSNKCLEMVRVVVSK